MNTSLSFSHMNRQTLNHRDSLSYTYLQKSQNSTEEYHRTPENEFSKSLVTIDFSQSPGRHRNYHRDNSSNSRSISPRITTPKKGINPEDGLRFTGKAYDSHIAQNNKKGISSAQIVSDAVQQIKHKHLFPLIEDLRQ
jgi:hypothetical protein